jgi:hypothetical protein
VAIENVGGWQMFSLQAGERASFFAKYQELLRVVLEFCNKFCGSGESSLAPNTYPKSFFCAKVEKSEPPGFHYKKVSHHSEGGSDWIHLIFFNLCWQSVKLIAQ